MDTIENRQLRFVVAPEEKRVGSKDNSVSKSKPKVKPRRHISQAKQIFARAKLYRLENVRKVGDGELITQPVETKGWLVMPPDMYDGIIPREAWDVAQVLTQGIAIKGFLIADDKRAIDRKLRRQEIINRVKSVDWGKVATETGRVVAAITVVGVAIVALPALLVVGAVATTVSLDPLLIAVTEDDEWIAVYEWWD